MIIVSRISSLAVYRQRTPYKWFARHFSILKPGFTVCAWNAPFSPYILRPYSSDTDYIEFENFVQSSSYVEQQPRFGLLNLPSAGHNVLVVQPRIKKGRRVRTDTTTALQLAEAVALLETLPGWKTAGKLTLKTDNDMRKLIFKSGNLERIQDCIKEKSATAVFINVDILLGVQHVALQELFCLPIYDRYTVVLNIFRHHARTKEAKLQIALAEIPYYRARISHLHKGTGRDKSGTGQTFYERQQQQLQSREVTLRRQLGELKGERTLLRKKRRQLEFPTVAVVGYTNAGKTSLIKLLTDDARLQPRNQLFATLDVTVHTGRLRALKAVLYIDTVGFISDIPTTLVASFASTLEDVILADVIVHVRDLSHPDREAQRTNVLETLERIGVPAHLRDTVIEVGNKIDLVSTSEGAESCTTDHRISCVDGTGLVELQETIERRLMENTGRTVARLRIPTGGAEYAWLYREGTLYLSGVDDRDPNYSIVDVVLTPAALSKFRHNFGSECLVE